MSAPISNPTTPFGVAILKSDRYSSEAILTATCGRGRNDRRRNSAKYGCTSSGREDHSSISKYSTEPHNTLICLIAELIAGNTILSVASTLKLVAICDSRDVSPSACPSTPTEPLPTVTANPLLATSLPDRFSSIDCGLMALKGSVLARAKPSSSSSSPWLKSKRPNSDLLNH